MYPESNESKTTRDIILNHMKIPYYDTVIYVLFHTNLVRYYLCIHYLSYIVSSVFDRGVIISLWHLLHLGKYLSHPPISICWSYYLFCKACFHSIFYTHWLEMFYMITNWYHIHCQTVSFDNLTVKMIWWLLVYVCSWFFWRMY